MATAATIPRMSVLVATASGCFSRTATARPKIFLPPGRAVSAIVARSWCSSPTDLAAAELSRLIVTITIITATHRRWATGTIAVKRTLYSVTARSGRRPTFGDVAAAEAWRAVGMLPAVGDRGRPVTDPLGDLRRPSGIGPRSPETPA